MHLRSNLLVERHGEGKSAVVRHEAFKIEWTAAPSIL